MSYAFQQPNPYLPPPQVALTGWHNPNQIHTLRGLAGGSFYWPESPFATATAFFSPTTSWTTAIRVATSTAVSCQTAPTPLSRPT